MDQWQDDINRQQEAMRQQEENMRHQDYSTNDNQDTQRGFDTSSKTKNEDSREATGGYGTRIGLDRETNTPNDRRRVFEDRSIQLQLDDKIKEIADKIDKSGIGKAYQEFTGRSLDIDGEITKQAKEQDILKSQVARGFFDDLENFVDYVLGNDSYLDDSLKESGLSKDEIDQIKAQGEEIREKLQENGLGKDFSEEIRSDIKDFKDKFDDLEEKSNNIDEKLKTSDERRNYSYHNVFKANNEFKLKINAYDAHIPYNDHYVTKTELFMTGVNFLRTNLLESLVEILLLKVLDHIDNQEDLDKYSRFGTLDDEEIEKVDVANDSINVDVDAPLIDDSNKLEDLSRYIEDKSDTDNNPDPPSGTGVDKNNSANNETDKQDEIVKNVKIGNTEISSHDVAKPDYDSKTKSNVDVKSSNGEKIEPVELKATYYGVDTNNLVTSYRKDDDIGDKKSHQMASTSDGIVVFSIPVSVTNDSIKGDNNEKDIRSFKNKDGTDRTKVTIPGAFLVSTKDQVVLTDSNFTVKDIIKDSDKGGFSFGDNIKDKISNSDNHPTINGFFGRDSGKVLNILSKVENADLVSSNYKDAIKDIAGKSSMNVVNKISDLDKRIESLERIEVNSDDKAELESTINKLQDERHEAEESLKGRDNISIIRNSENTLETKIEAKYSEKISIDNIDKQFEKIPINKTEVLTERAKFIDKSDLSNNDKNKLKNAVIRESKLTSVSESYSKISFDDKDKTNSVIEKIYKSEIKHGIQMGEVAKSSFSKDETWSKIFDNSHKELITELKDKYNDFEKYNGKDIEITPGGLGGNTTIEYKTDNDTSCRDLRSYNDKIIYVETQKEGISSYTEYDKDNIKYIKLSDNDKKIEITDNNGKIEAKDSNNSRVDIKNTNLVDSKGQEISIKEALTSLFDTDVIENTDEFKSDIDSFFSGEDNRDVEVSETNEAVEQTNADNDNEFLDNYFDIEQIPYADDTEIPEYVDTEYYDNDLMDDIPVDYDDSDIPVPYDSYDDYVSYLETDYDPYIANGVPNPDNEDNVLIENSADNDNLWNESVDNACDTIKLDYESKTGKTLSDDKQTIIKNFIGNVNTKEEILSKSSSVENISNALSTAFKDDFKNLDLDAKNKSIRNYLDNKTGSFGKMALSEISKFDNNDKIEVNTNKQDVSVSITDNSANSNIEKAESNSEIDNSQTQVTKETSKPELGLDKGTYNQDFNSIAKIIEKYDHFEGHTGILTEALSVALDDKAKPEQIKTWVDNIEKGTDTAIGAVNEIIGFAYDNNIDTSRFEDPYGAASRIETNEFIDHYNDPDSITTLSDYFDKIAYEIPTEIGNVPMKDELNYNNCDFKIEAFWQNVENYIQDNVDDEGKIEKISYLIQDFAVDAGEVSKTFEKIEGLDIKAETKEYLSNNFYNAIDKICDTIYGNDVDTDESDDFEVKRDDVANIATDVVNMFVRDDNVKETIADIIKERADFTDNKDDLLGRVSSVIKEVLVPNICDLIDRPEAGIEINEKIKETASAHIDKVDIGKIENLIDVQIHSSGTDEGKAQANDLMASIRSPIAREVGSIYENAINKTDTDEARIDIKSVIYNVQEPEIVRDKIIIPILYDEGRELEITDLDRFDIEEANMEIVESDYETPDYTVDDEADLDPTERFDEIDDNWNDQFDQFANDF